jgi:trimethylamine:corrinoid methyltransferase-like protein
MIRKFLNQLGINVTDKEFKEILEITTADIRENRVKFGKRTSLRQMLIIAKMSANMLMGI